MLGEESYGCKSYTLSLRCRLLLLHSSEVRAVPEYTKQYRGVEGFFELCAMPSNRRKIAVREKGAKSLYVRMFPADLLRRLNGVAELIGMDRDAFVTELLKQDLRRFDSSQTESSEWWKTRTVLNSQKT